MVSSLCLTFLLLSVACIHGDEEATNTDESTVTAPSHRIMEPTGSSSSTASTTTKTTVTSGSTITSPTTSSTTTTTSSTTTTASSKTATDQTTTSGPKTTTSGPKTTTSGPKTTTFGPKTTTSGPKTTTSGPETTTSGPETTTSSPKTTTSGSTTTTTTTSSGSTSDPAVVGWHVSGKRDVCLLLTTGIQLRISYPVAVNKTATAVFNVPNNGTSSGSCAGQETLNITYTAATVGNTTYPVSVSFMLDNNSTQSTYRLRSVNVSVPLVARLLPNISADVGTGLFRAHVNLTDEIPSLPVNTSYRCLSHRLFQLIPDSKQRLTGQLMLVKTELEGFRNTNTTKFSPPLVCAADRQNTSDVVPIAVGVSLALLVVLILAGYLVAQRRHRRNQYQSI